MTTKTVNVSNAAELTAALKAATGGEKIELAAGDYGNLRLVSYGIVMHNTSNVTIESADPAHKANFNTILADKVGNLTFNNIAITPQLTDVSRALVGFTVTNSHDVTLTNSTLKGPIVTADQAASSAAINGANNDYFSGVAGGNAFFARFSSNITISHNDIQQFFAGGYLQQTDNAQIKNNEIHNITNDYLDVATLTNSVISGNYMHDPKGSADSAFHPDFIQIYTDNEKSNTHDLVIDSNIFVNNSVGGGGNNVGGQSSSSDASAGSQVMQTIILQQKNPNPAMDYQNITVTNNLIYGDQSKGVYVQNGHNLNIANNTIISNNDGTSGLAVVPGVQLVGRTSDATITNNVTSFVSVPAEATNVTQTGNFIIQRSDESASNFVGKLFVDALNGNHADYSQGDLKALADSIIVKNHLGSNLAWSLDDIKQPALYIDVQTLGGLNKQTFTYNAMTLFKMNIDLTGAKIVIDFGDGHTSTSFSGTHTYTNPGAYSMNATITLANGQTITGSEGVQVQDFRALNINFDKGIVDESYLVNKLTPVGATLVKTELGQSLHLDGAKSYLGLGRTYDTTKQSEYTVSFDFKKDAAANTGTLFQQSGVGGVLINAKGQLQLNMSDSDNHSSVQTVAANLNDTVWHQFTMTFDAKAGVGNFYLDGVLIATHSGFSGTQYGNWEATLGSPWNGSLIGSYDNVSYLSGALSAAQVQASWGALQAELHPSTPVGGAGADPSEAAVQAQMVGAYLAAHGQDSGVHYAAGQTGMAMNSATGDDLVYGNDKGDFYWSKGGHDIFIGGTGNDTVNGAQYVFETAGNNMIRGTNGDDVIYGGSGNDIINGYGGSDKLYGGAGDDRISGGGGAGNILDGGAGNDYLEAHGKGDILLGGDGNDVLRAYGVGGDTFDGGKGVDQIYGSGGNDKIVYDANDSVILGGKGFDTLLVSANNGDLDFSKIGKFGGIEKVDMTNGTAEKLTLHYSDIMQADNHTLFITGDAKDTVQLAAGVTLTAATGTVAGTADNLSAGHTFTHYTSMSGNTRLDLFVESDIQVKMAVVANH